MRFRLPLQRLVAPLIALASVGCFAPEDGPEPPLDRIYFPTGLAVSPTGDRLYVANSDFDLQFNAGSLQVFDLKALNRRLPRHCESRDDCRSGEECDLPTATSAGTHWCVPADSREPCDGLGEKLVSDRNISPGRCAPLDARPFLLDSVGIGAFATDVLYRDNPAGGGRLFIPARGDSTLHWVDVDETGASGEELDCGQFGSDGSCDDDHRRGQNSDAENTRGLSMPREPFGIAADAAGEVLVLTHQSNSSASLFVNDWTQNGPRLEFVLNDLPSGAVGVTALPEPKFIKQEGVPFDPGFLLSFRASPELVLVRYFADATSNEPRPFITEAGRVGISANSLGFDSRGVAVDPLKRQSCEDDCETSASDLSTCYRDCAGIPLDVYVSNRAPSTLLIGETRPNDSPTASDDLPYIYDTLPLSFGPSRVVIGDIIDQEGNPARRVFVVCFDSQLIYVFDPIGRRIERIIETGRGPHAFVLGRTNASGQSAPTGLAYIGHFTDSYIGVVDLDQRHREAYGTIIATLADPTPPRASK